MPLRSPSRDASNLLKVVVGVAVIAALYFARAVLIPLTLAMLFAFILTPPIRLFERARLGRIVSTFLVVFLAIAGMSATGWTVAKQFGDVLNQLPQYRTNIRAKIDSLHWSRSQTINNISDTIKEISSHDIQVTTASHASGGGPISFSAARISPEHAWAASKRCARNCIHNYHSHTPGGSAESFYFFGWTGAPGRND